MVIHLPVGVILEKFAHYVDIDNDVAISVDNTDAEICAEIQAAAADSGVDTVVDSVTSRQTLAPPASRMSYKVYACCVRIWRPSAVWTTADGGCVHVGEEGSALIVHAGCYGQAHTLRTFYSRPKAVRLTGFDCICI